MVQQFINHILWELDFAFAFLDGIFIANTEEQMSHFIQVFEGLYEFGVLGTSQV